MVEGGFKTKKCTIIIDSIYNALDYIEPSSIDTVITSPPYWNRRKYATSDQIGDEPSPEAYVKTIADKVGAILYPLLKKTGSYFLNIGRSIIKKQVTFFPERVAMKMQGNGWAVLDMIIWHKLNSMSLSTDRRWNTTSYEPVIWLVKNPDEYAFFFKRISEKHAESTIKRHLKDVEKMKALGLKKMYHKGSKYHNGLMPEDSIVGGDQYGKFITIDIERGKQPHNVWDMVLDPTRLPHPAPFPRRLAEIPMLATCPQGGTVFDPFTGSGTVAEVAMKHGFNFIGFEISEEYVETCIKPRLQWHRKKLDYEMEIIKK